MIQDRFLLSQEVIGFGVDRLAKDHSMQELQAMFCKIVKAPTAPKFSDKKTAAKRVIAMATEAMKQVEEYNNRDKADPPAQKAAEIVAFIKKPGRPKVGPREYRINDVGNIQDSLPAQARDVFFALADACTDWVPESKVRELIESSTEIKTTQSKWRIFQYYRGKLISKGLLEMRNIK